MIFIYGWLRQLLLHMSASHQWDFEPISVIRSLNYTNDSPSVQSTS